LIPDGSLHLLPFCALLTESTATAPGRLPYLIRRHSITYVPSASVACQLRRERLAREPTWDQQLVAFADPAFTDAAFPRLRGTRQEVARIARLFDNHRDLDAIEAGSLDRFESTRVSLRLGNEASREAVEMRFVSEANPRSSRFVHFATHGLADAVRPQFSWLLFASGTDSTAFWRTFEIFNARIPSELVVLSACETALGRLVQGEGLLGLARAFFYAGALGIFASLWRVSDAATATLIEAFYRHRLQDRREDGNAIGPAEALRRAQLELLDQGPWTAHPYFWAPFVFQGETP
jgi:CHAT domain-containing protein